MLYKNTLTEFTVVRLRTKNSKPNPYDIPYLWENIRRENVIDKQVREKQSQKSFFAGDPYIPAGPRKVRLLFASIFIVPILLYFLILEGSWVGDDLAAIIFVGSGLACGILWIRSLGAEEEKLKPYYVAAHRFMKAQKAYRFTLPLAIKQLELQQKQLELQALQTPRKAKKILARITKFEEKKQLLTRQLKEAEEGFNHWLFKLKEGIRLVEMADKAHFIEPERHNLAFEPGFEWVANPEAESPVVISYREHIHEIQKQIATLKKGEADAA